MARAFSFGSNQSTSSAALMLGISSTPVPARLGDGGRTPAQHARHTGIQLAGRVPEQVEGVLHAARSVKRAGINRESQ